MKPVRVKTTVEVPRVLDIIVAWYANISLMWFYIDKIKNVQFLVEILK
jgi:hypothetical protein